MVRAMVMAIVYNSQYPQVREVAKTSTHLPIIITELYLEYAIRYGSS
jgi:hypothetical protein